MNLGDRIRIQRHKLNMTQEELSQGIISASYLSKIENGSKEASIEVVEMLCEKLGIIVTESKHNIEIQDKIQDWYYELLLVENRKKIETLFRELNNTKNLIITEELDTLFVIGKIRYFIINNKIPEAISLMERLKNVEDLFTPLQKYYWYKFKGNYFFSTKQFEEAITMYFQAEGIVVSLKLSTLEVADLYYSIGITSNYLYRHKVCIDYTNRALEIYSKEFAIKRMAECRINLGVIYKRTGEYITALEEYQYAEKITNHLQNERLIYITKYNIGFLLYERKKYEESYKYFEACIQYANDINSKLICICTLMKANFEEKNYIKSKDYALQGVTLINDQINEANPEITLEFHIFNHYLNEEYQQFESKLKKSLLPLLMKRHGKKELSFYYRFLGTYYKSLNKYKDATQMFEEAINQLNDI